MREAWRCSVMKANNADSYNYVGAMDSSRTISEVKSSFIRSQVRILSEALEPPEDWKNYAVETEEGELPEKVIGDVLHKGTNHLSAQDMGPLPILSFAEYPNYNASSRMLTHY